MAERDDFLTTEEKLRKYFDGMCVKKDSSLEQFSALSIPSFIRDWFIRKYSDKEGRLNVAFVSQEIRRVVPRRNEWTAILDKMVSDGQTVKFIGKIEVRESHGSHAIVILPTSKPLFFLFRLLESNAFP